MSELTNNIKEEPRPDNDVFHLLDSDDVNQQQQHVMPSMSGLRNEVVFDFGRYPRTQNGHYLDEEDEDDDEEDEDDDEEDEEDGKRTSTGTEGEEISLQETITGETEMTGDRTIKLTKANRYGKGKKKKKRSFIYEHLEYDPDRGLFRCKLCTTYERFFNVSTQTSSAIRHLESQHGINREAISSDADPVDSIARLVVTSNLSFDDIDNPHFQVIVGKLNLRAVTSEMVSERVTKLATLRRDRMRLKIEADFDHSFFGITLDFWDSEKGLKFVDCRVSKLNPFLFVLDHFVLPMGFGPECPVSALLCSMRERLALYGISNDIPRFAVVESAESFQLFGKLLNFWMVQSVGHLLHRVVSSSIDSFSFVSDILHKANGISALIKSSPHAIALFQRAQTSQPNGSDHPPPPPHPPVGGELLFQKEPSTKKTKRGPGRPKNSSRDLSSPSPSPSPSSASILNGSSSQSENAEARRQELEAKRKQKKNTKLFTYKPDRWDSAYRALKRLKKMRHAVLFVLSSLELYQMSYTMHEWRQIDGLLEVLRPFAKVFKTISTKPSFSSICSIDHFFKSILVHLSSGPQRRPDFFADPNDPICHSLETFRRHTAAQLNERASQEYEKENLDHWSFYDPRFARSMLTNEHVYHRVLNDMNHIRLPPRSSNLSSSSTSLSSSSSSSSSSSGSQSPIPVSSSSSSFKPPKKRSRPSPQTGNFISSLPPILPANPTAKLLVPFFPGATSQDRTPIEEVELYFKVTARVEANQDPLVWWAVNSRLFPRLCVLAAKHLVVPSTSSAFELSLLRKSARFKRDKVPPNSAEDRLTLLYNEFRT